MWRYLAGGIAAIALIAVGWLLFNGHAASERSLLSAQSPARNSPAAEDVAPGDDELPTALPDATRSREQKRFDRYDKDRDDKITRDEYLASRRKAFQKLDTNGDGRLSFDEWVAKTSTKFAGADADKSGTLSRAEFATTAVKRKTRPRCACPEPTANAASGADD